MHTHALNAIKFLFRLTPFFHFVDFSNHKILKACTIHFQIKTLRKESKPHARTHARTRTNREEREKTRNDHHLRSICFLMSNTKMLHTWLLLVCFHCCICSRLWSTKVCSIKCRCINHCYWNSKNSSSKTVGRNAYGEKLFLKFL